MKGSYIVFEGIDGSGKSTQIQSLKTYLEKKGQTVVLVREPGSITFKDTLRSIVKNNSEINADTRQFLFMADRSEVISKEVIPALDKGFTVLSDRSFLTGMSYCLSLETEWDDLANLNKVALHGVLPDLVINIEISVDTMISRIFGRNENLDRIEQKVKDNAQLFKYNLRLAIKKIGLPCIHLNGELSPNLVSDNLISSF